MGDLRLLGWRVLADGQPGQERGVATAPNLCFLTPGGRRGHSARTSRPGQSGEPLHHHRFCPCTLLGAAGCAGRRATALQPGLSLAWRLFLLATLGATLVYAFVQQQEATSNWVGLVAVLGTLAWLRFPRLRWPALALILVLVAIGVLFPVVYDFAGGDAEWQLSGGSRLVLSQRVIDVTMRNPITGLGPAAYRRYAAMEPLQYGRAFWVVPRINSHNNYVDLFSQVGLVGLAFFLWFAVEVARLGYRLHSRYTTGFKAAYVNGVLAAGAGALVLMVFADWILPFVYNIGFPGFQASVLVWMFLGGLVALEGMEEKERS